MLVLDAHAGHQSGKAEVKILFGAPAGGGFAGIGDKAIQSEAQHAVAQDAVNEKTGIRAHDAGKGQRPAADDQRDGDAPDNDKQQV